VALAILGSIAFDFGQQSVQVALAEPVRGANYCEDETATKGDEPSRQNAATAQSPAESHGEATESNCPSDMVEVKGDHCQVVEQICEEYINEKRDRCARYRNKVRCFGKTRAIHVCVDRYEYPNQVGVKPTVAVTWEEARETCASEGKRLCTADEWTQACEGAEHTPHPYGFVRNPEACNHDKPYIVPDDNAYHNPATRAKEVERLSQSEPSGSRPGCVSSHGVFDMTGNVDEWVLNESGSVNGPEYQSGLKGGYWGPVRNRCRPMTTDHNSWHHGYQIGFRCCANPNAVERSKVEQPQNKVPADSEQMSAGLVSRS
jgi:hypothetical protein